MGVVCGQDGLLVQVAKIGLDLASTGGFSRKNGEKFLQQCIYISIEDILGVCLFELFCEIRNIRKLSQRSTKNFRKFFNHTYENFFFLPDTLGREYFSWMRDPRFRIQKCKNQSSPRYKNSRYLRFK